MHRDRILRLLNEYSPLSKEEIQYKEQIISFIKQHTDCFERTCDIGHLTASAWLLNKTGDKALLMHHAKLNSWFQVGGHCDGDSDVLSAAIKEAREESGIEHIEAISQSIFDIDAHYIPQNPKEAAHFHYDIRFLLQVKSDEDLRINHEAKELRWIGKNRSELPSNERSVTRMFDKWVGLA